MWQFVFSHAVTVQACTSVERFRGVDPSVYYPEIRPFLLILCKQSRPHLAKRTICQNLGNKLTTSAQLGTMTENCLITPYIHQGSFHSLSSNFKLQRLLLAVEVVAYKCWIAWHKQLSYWNVIQGFAGFADSIQGLEQQEARALLLTKL
jgi:hypothetical protein